MTVNRKLAIQHVEPLGIDLEHIERAQAPPSALMSPAALTSAKSRTRRNSRLAMRGVPRERSAMRVAASGRSRSFRIDALRTTILTSSSVV